MDDSLCVAATSLDAAPAPATDDLDDLFGGAPSPAAAKQKEEEDEEVRLDGRLEKEDEEDGG